MRILQLHDERWDSGLAHYALTLSAELARRGHRVQFWASEGSYAAGAARSLGLAVREIKRPWLTLPALRAELRAARVELINAHTGSAHSLGAALAAGAGAALVRTRGDVRPPAGHALALALARRTSLYIAANGRLAGQLEKAFPGSRVEVVHQGIAEPRRPAPPPPEKTVGLVGRLDPVKGHEDLLRAAASLARRHPDARVLLAGGGQPERRAQLESLAGSLGLGASARLLGFVPDAAAFMAGCRVGVVASTGSEAVSRAALEWMSQGRALVATRVGCLPELVEDGVTGILVPPGEPQALATALDQLLREPEFAARLGERARERFERLFGLEGFGRRTEELYASAVGAAAR